MKPKEPASSAGLCPKAKASRAMESSSLRRLGSWISFNHAARE